MGIEVVPTIFIEGIDYDPSQKDAIMSRITEQAKEVAKQF